jgi:hypothetical protein
MRLGLGRRLSVLLAHLGHALLIALALEFGVMVVHTSSSRLTLDLPLVPYRDREKGGIYACLPKNAISNYSGLSQTIFASDAESFALT